MDLDSSWKARDFSEWPEGRWSGTFRLAPPPAYYLAESTGGGLNSHAVEKLKNVTPTPTRRAATKKKETPPPTPPGKAIRCCPNEWAQFKLFKVFTKQTSLAEARWVPGPWVQMQLIAGWLASRCPATVMTTTKREQRVTEVLQIMTNATHGWRSSGLTVLSGFAGKLCDGHLIF